LGFLTLFCIPWTTLFLFSLVLVGDTVCWKVPAPGHPPKFVAGQTHVIQAAFIYLFNVFCVCDFFFCTLFAG